MDDDISGSGKKRGPHIQWDEETIAEHDKERGTRQKIDEPPTPYAYGTESPMAVDEKGEDGVVLGSSPAGDGKGVLNEWEALNARLTYEQYVQNQGGESIDGQPINRPAQTPSSVGESVGMAAEGTGDADEEAEKAAKAKEFAKRRAAHYNEFKVIQAMRARAEQEDEDEDD